MKKKLIYTCTLFCCLLFLMGCADDLVSGIFRGDGVQLTINLNVPGESSAATRAIKTRVGGENQYDNGLDPNTEYQRYIADNDLYILVFENTSSSSEENWTLLAVPTITNISGTNGDETRVLTAMMSRVSGSKTLLVDVVANLAENGVTDVDFSTMIGQSRETIYNAIGSFAYPENSDTNPYGVWSLGSFNESGQATGEHRYLPMWGQSSTATTGGRMTYTVDGNTTELEVHCGLYRSVAKMGLLVDSECNTFQPTELYVYYINNEGTFVSLPVQDTNWSPSINVQYTLPEVPETTTNTQRAIEYPLVYKFSALQAGGSYLNNIYVTEADNKGGEDTPVCLVVGGYYLGGNYEGEGLVDGSSTTDQYTLNYYRIDLESLTTGEDGTTTSGAFDVIRNHSYLFNIKNANNPGTSDPDPRSAASGLEVEILDYTEVPMHGINTQYTLTVNKSLFAFEGATTSVGALAVSTDGGVEWTLITDWSDGITDSNGNILVEAGSIPDWAVAYDPNEGAHTNSNDTVYIAVGANVNNESLRNGSFWIQAGDVIKRIDFVQDYDETGNSYIVTEAGTYDLKIDIRGNGNTEAWTSEDGSAKEAIDFNMGSSITDVAYAAIIWETADGFVTIPNPYDISESGCLSYVVNNVSLTQFGDWTGNVFDPGNGANALIGVYNSNNELVWSYHIWGLGDYADGVLTEGWLVGNTTSTYYFMDRNLGAYSNLPGSKSFGLLYQWGRKDPFIGAYREAGSDGTYERDYRQVRKQYTRHYPQINDSTYVWRSFDDSSFADSYDGEATLDQFTVQNPTTILQYGLLSDIHDGNEAHGLWGTTSYGYDNSETGNKTMYDPCPPGYRVPSLNALTINDGHNDMWAKTTLGGGGGGPTGGTTGNNEVEHSSYTARYVPIKEGDHYRTQASYTADFISDAPFYGFWFDYSGAAGFESTYERDDQTGYGVTYYSSTSLNNGTCGWMTGYSNSNPGKPDNVTWLPMAGIYNGTVNHFGRAGLTDRIANGSEPYLPASSLQVSSVIWANSPTDNTTGGGNYPAGLLLHGTEGAYAPILETTQDDDGTTYTPYQYSPGSYSTRTSVSSSTVATDGPGYWTTATTGYSTDAAGWWTGSVDAGKESMDNTIGQGQWNYTTGNERIGNYTNWSDFNGLAGGGRHFHSYADPSISTLANPSYAASVRCIKDKDALTPKDDKLYYEDESGEWTAATDITLNLYDYSSSTPFQNVKDVITLGIQFAEEWEVTYPGAKWISISPTSGTTTEQQGTTQAIEITYLEDYLPAATASEADRTAVITITTARGTVFTITVVYVGGTRGQN